MWNHLNFKRWQLPAVAVLTALAVASTPTKAFARQPGEGTFYTHEHVKQAGDVQLQGSLAEARNGGHQLDVWRANDDSNQVWLSYDLGAPFTIGSTETFASPAVAAWGAGGNFMVFHTGTNGNIYYTFIFGPNSNAGFWQAIPGQTTPNTMSVSVAQIGQDSNLEFMVYRGSGNDTRVFGTWLQDSAVWSNPENIAGGLAITPPTICLNNAASSLWVAAIGLDNQLWTTSQPLGAPSWARWTPRGQFAAADLWVGTPIPPPSCAATDNGNVVLDYVDTYASPHYGVFNNGGELVTEWTADITGSQTFSAVNLTSSGNAVWSLLTGIDAEGVQKIANGVPATGKFSGWGWWKTVYIVP